MWWHQPQTLKIHGRKVREGNHTQQVARRQSQKRKQFSFYCMVLSISTHSQSLGQPRNNESGTLIRPPVRATDTHYTIFYELYCATFSFFMWPRCHIHLHLRHNCCIWNIPHLANLSLFYWLKLLLKLREPCFSVWSADQQHYPQTC